jgi:hypothetical protein
VETNPLVMNQWVTERDLIHFIVENMFFVDFGVVKAVSSDKKTVDVQHAIKPMMAGVQQEERETKGVELLWPASLAFSMRWAVAVGDTVLLVGLKDYVKTVGSDVPGQTDVALHYTQETMKAISLGAYNASSTCTIEQADGKLKLNGDTKQFVTWQELQNVLNLLWTAMTTTPIVGSGSPQPTWVGITSLDISAAKTTTVVTGG